MVKNVIEDIVVPESPKVLPNEQLQVYVPTASNTQKGIAKFNDGPFEVVDGEVKIKEEYLNDVIGKGFVAKSKLSSNVYGTDDEGNDVNIPYSTDAEASKIVKRTLEGDVVVPIYTTEPNTAISRKYFLEQLAGRVPVVKNETLDSKFLYSYFYDNAGNARLVKADSELDSEIAVRLQDGHLRVPYSPLSRFTVDTAVNSKYLLDNYSTTAVINDKIQASEDRLSLNDVTGFTITPAKDINGNVVFGVYNFYITLASGDVLKQQLDLPFEAVQLASVDDYIGDDGKRYLEIRFVDESITPLNIELDEIFNFDVFSKQFIEKLESEYDEQVYLQDAEGNVSLKQVSWEGLKPRAIVRRNSGGDIVIGPTTYSIDGAISKGQMHTYVDDKLHIGPEAPTASNATLWVDTDEESGSSGGGTGGKLYLHTITAFLDYSFEGGPIDDCELCKFYSYSSTPITQFSDIPISCAHLPSVVDLTFVMGYGIFVPDKLTRKNDSIAISGYSIPDGEYVEQPEFHSLTDTVTEVI